MLSPRYAQCFQKFHWGANWIKECRLGCWLINNGFVCQHDVMDWIYYKRGWIKNPWYSDQKYISYQNQLSHSIIDIILGLSNVIGVKNFVNSQFLQQNSNLGYAHYLPQKKQRWEL
jgi:hypothetical protein